MSASLDASHTRPQAEAESSSELTANATPSLAVSRRFPALRYCAGVYLSVCGALILLGATAWGLSGDGATSVAARYNGWQNSITGWVRMDSHYFLAIAKSGYQSQHNTAAFYPFYPALIRAVSYLCFGNLLVAAFLVSNATLLAALVILYRLTEREYDTPTARRAVLYLCLFPTAFFLFIAYSEATFLLAVLGALALARSGRWGWASVAGMAAGLTRSAGVVVAIALVAEAIHQTLTDRRSSAGTGSWRPLAVRAAGRFVASSAPVAGTAGYLVFWQLRFHNWAYPLQLEKIDWGRAFSWPWVTLWHGFELAVWNGPLARHGWLTFDFVVVAIGLALGVWVAVRTRPVYAVYCWASILFFLAESWPGRPLGSDPRYLVVIFPLVWALARLGNNPRAHEAIIALSSASLALCGFFFLTTAGLY